MARNNNGSSSVPGPDENNSQWNSDPGPKERVSNQNVSATNEDTDIVNAPVDDNSSEENPADKDVQRSIQPGESRSSKYATEVTNQQAHVPSEDEDPYWVDENDDIY